MLDQIIGKLEERLSKLNGIRSKALRKKAQKTLALEDDIYYEIDPLPDPKLFLKAIADNADSEPLKSLLELVEVIDFYQINVSKDTLSEFKEFFMSLPESFVSGKCFEFCSNRDALEEVLILNTQMNGYIVPPVPLKFHGINKKESYLEKQYQVNSFVRSLVKKISDRAEIEKEELSTILVEIATASKLQGGIVELLYHLKEFAAWGLHPLKDLEVIRAGPIEGVGLLDAMDEIYKEHIPETIVYSYKAEDLYPGDDVYFNAVEVNAGNYNDFRSFHKFHIEHDGGRRAFLESIKRYDNPETTVFSVFVSNKPYEGSAKGLKPEMYVTAVTSTNAVFGTHMGIQRVSEWDATCHKGLSVYLHKFAASVITDFNSKAAFMITTPLGIMRTIIQKALHKHGKVDSMSANMVELGDDTQYEVSQTDRSCKGWEKGKKRDIVDRCYLSDLLEHQKKQGVKFPATHFGVKKSKDVENNSEIILPDGSVVAITPEQKKGEFAWYFDNSNQIPNFDSPTIAVDYNVLAELGGKRFPIEKQMLGADGGAFALDLEQ